MLTKPQPTTNWSSRNNEQIRASATSSVHNLHKIPLQRNYFLNISHMNNLKKLHIFLESIIMHYFRTLIILNHTHKHPEQKAYILVHIRILNFRILIIWCQCCSHITSWHTHHVVINDSNKTKISCWDSITWHNVQSKFHENHSVVSKSMRWNTHQQYAEPRTLFYFSKIGKSVISGSLSPRHGASSGCGRRKGLRYGG